jgi:hypothetical protein
MKKKDRWRIKENMDLMVVKLLRYHKSQFKLEESYSKKKRKNVIAALVVAILHLWEEMKKEVKA